MGRIVSVRRAYEGERQNGFILEINLDQSEAQRLLGHYDDIHMFCENICDYETKISTRGRNEATKYFLIPTKFRKNVNLDNVVKCQRLEFCDKYFFIYAVKKDIFENHAKKKLIS